MNDEFSGKSERSLSRYFPSDALGDFQPKHQTRVVPNEWHLWDVFKRRWKLMIPIFIAIVAGGMVHTRLQRPVYSATALMAIPSERSVTTPPDDLRLLGDLASMTNGRTVAGVIQVLQSPDVIESATARLTLEELNKGFQKKSLRKRTLPKWAFGFDTAKDSDVIAVTASAYDPHVAAVLANTVVSTYIERDQEYSERASRMGRERLALELRSIGRKLNDAQKKLTAFKHKSKIVSAEDQLKQMTESLAALESEQDKANMDLAASRQQARILRAQLGEENRVIDERQTIEMNPSYQQALANLGNLEAKRISLMQEYTPKSAEIKSINAEINAARHHANNIASMVVTSKVRSRNPLITNYTESVVGRAAAEAKVHVLNKALIVRSKKMANLPDQERVYLDLERRVRILDGTFQTLSSKYYALLVNEQSRIPTAIFAAAAQPPSSPMSPDKQKNTILFLLLGSFAAVIAAAIAERMDRRIRYDETITELTGEPPLTTIPYVKPLRKTTLKLDNLDGSSQFVESFRVLRNIIRYSSTSPIKTLAITSPSRAEGKTTTSVGLAVVMAMAGKKVLIVDCDFRRPFLHKHIQIPSDIGFTNLANGSNRLEEAICSTSVDNLFCLPCGPVPSSPADFLDLPESRKLINELAQEYDYVILDCPPANGLSDTQIISTIADGVVMVVSANQTLLPRFVDALRVLEQMNAPFLGCVINRSRLSKYYHEYYGRLSKSNVEGESLFKELDSKNKEE